MPRRSQEHGDSTKEIPAGEGNINTQRITRYAIRETMGLVAMGVALFWSAGRWNWWQARAALGVMLVWIIATAMVILRTNPGLLPGIW